jgi:hypothetical protein
MIRFCLIRQIFVNPPYEAIRAIARCVDHKPAIRAEDKPAIASYEILFPIKAARAYNML